MKNEIANYIKTEKDLAKLKIKMLERVNKSYSNRLIRQQEDFISYDFSKISFSSIEECRDALSLFKVSRLGFLSKYNEKSIALQDKINVLVKHAASIKIIDSKIDGFPFVSVSKALVFKEDGTLRKCISKRIAILKVFLLCAVRHIQKTGSLNVDDIISKIYDYLIKKDIDISILSDDEICYYDSYIENYINVINLYDFNLFKYIKKTENTGVITVPILHSGNERVHPVIIELFDNSNKKINVKKHKFSNYPTAGGYYKCIKIGADQISSIDDIDFSSSKVICNFSRREMEHNSENLLWLKFVLSKVLC